MIKQETHHTLLPDALLKKWGKDTEMAKGLTYVEGQTCVVITTISELDGMVKYLIKHEKKIIGFDTEATSTRPESAKIVGMSFSVDEDRGFYVPVGHKHGTQIELQEALRRVQPVLRSKYLAMAGGKYDWHLMRRHGIEVTYGYDSQSLSRLLGEVEYGVGLKPTVARMFGERMIEFSDVVTQAKQKKGETFADVEIGLASLYAVPDAIYARKAVRYALANLPEPIKKFLLRVEHESMRIGGEMEWVGVPLDEEYLRAKIEAGEEIAKTLQIEAVEGLKSVAQRRGRSADEIPDDLNLRSAPAMQKALFDVCGFEPVKLSKKTNKPSADKQSIETMAERDPEVDWVRRYRSAVARVHDLREMYDFGLHEDDWFWVHGSITPTGTATGRWSSKGPNLQNIPKGESVYESLHSEWRVNARDAVCAPPGYYIITADYSQIELRVAAGESQCRSWIEAFANGDDVHSASGAAVHNVPIEEVTKKQRADGKTFNFALLFGQEVKSTAEKLGVSVAEAQRMQNNYWSGLPEVRSWIDKIHSTVRQQKYVETKFGRRRWLRGIDDDNKWTVLQNLRESVNTVVQGTAADILKIGLMRQEPIAERHGAKLFLVVHDQYVWLVPETTAPDVFCTEMDEVINFDIEGYPEMVSDYSIGKRFDSLVDFENAAAVPATWDEVFQQKGDIHTGSETEEVLSITVAEFPTTTELFEFARLLEAHPGGRTVELSVTKTGATKELAMKTTLGPEDEMEIRAAIGASARVDLV